MLPGLARSRPDSDDRGRTATTFRQDRQIWSRSAGRRIEVAPSRGAGICLDQMCILRLPQKQRTLSWRFCSNTCCTLPGLFTNSARQKSCNGCGALAADPDAATSSRKGAPRRIPRSGHPVPSRESTVKGGHDGPRAQEKTVARRGARHHPRRAPTLRPVSCLDHPVTVARLR